jgi:O-antigen chain-terminating methyltransferase
MYVADAERRVGAAENREWLTPAPPLPRPHTEHAIETASALAHVGQGAAGTRLSGVKKLLLRGMRIVTRDQNAFNAAVVGSLHAVASDAQKTRSTLMRQLGEERVLVTSLEASVKARADALELLGSQLTTLQTALDRQRADFESRLAEQRVDLEARLAEQRVDLEAKLAEQRADLESRLARQGAEHGVDLRRLSTQVASATEQLRAQDDRLTLLLQEARSRLPGPLDTDQLAQFTAQLARRFDALYAEFENRYRGARNDVLVKLEQYSGFLDLEQLGAKGPMIDLGAGRGEWLEFLARQGINAYGIDVNDDVAAIARGHGVDVRVDDGLAHLRGLQQGSVGLVSMFHVAEHLEFETLFDVLRAAHGVLAPGGVLVLETPNPTNLNVGAAAFYRDPTHRAPLHPQLVEFLCSAAGFDQVEVRFINPPTELPFALPTASAADPDVDRLVNHLNWALLGPQDYCVVAYKSGPGTS